MHALTPQPPPTPGFHRAWIGDEIERVIAWMQAKFSDATPEDGAGETVMVIRVLQRECDRLAHGARRQAMRRKVKL